MYISKSSLTVGQTTKGSESMIPIGLKFFICPSNRSLYQFRLMTSQTMLTEKAKGLKILMF